MGLDKALQGAMGRALKVISRVRGFKATYTLVTDLATMATSSLTVFMESTPTEWTRNAEDGRWIRTTEDTYFISREYLKVAGVYYDPTPFDSFVDFGTTAPVKYIEIVEDMEEVAPGFKLTVRATRRVTAKG